VSRDNFVLANQNLEQSMNNLNSLKSAELIEIATNAAPAEKAVAKAEIVRRHENRVAKNKKPIPAVAKFLGLAPASPVKPKASEKPAKPAKVEKTDAELVESYGNQTAAFLKNMLKRAKDPRKIKFIKAALAAKSAPVEAAPVREQFGELVAMLTGMSAADKAEVMAALSA
jgi:hypothetical protein